MKIRNLLFGFVMSVVVLCASVAVNTTNAIAASCPILPYKVYYTDASMTVVCGVEDTACAGTYSDCYTPYYQTFRKACCNPQ